MPDRNLLVRRADACIPHPPSNVQTLGMRIMIGFSFLKPKAVVSRSNFLRAGAALSGVVVAIGFVGNVAANPLSAGSGSTEMVGTPSSEPTFLAHASSEDNLARSPHPRHIWAHDNASPS